MTMVDGQELAIQRANHVAVKSAFTFGDQISHTLAIRGEDKILLRRLNRYIKREKDGPLYTRLYDKYFTDKSKIAQHQESQPDALNGKKMISEFDHLVQQHSRQYGLDWRLISAQMFQESRFNPTAVSFAGATGLMQIMPRTGRSLGFSELYNPETSIKAGTKYMGKLFHRFDPELAVEDRMWFTLASYNAGIGHVNDARILAKKLDLDPDRWFGNVEKAMLFLSEESYFKKARYGYVRGKEPVAYVRLIKKMYANYTNIAKLDESLAEASLSKPVLAKLTVAKQTKPGSTILKVAKAKKAIAKLKVANVSKKPAPKIATRSKLIIDFNAMSNEIASLNEDLNLLFSKKKKILLAKN
jgi:membrane-bound lytic murein transglycosylase F